MRTASSSLVALVVVVALVALAGAWALTREQPSPPLSDEAIDDADEPAAPTGVPGARGEPTVTETVSASAKGVIQVTTPSPGTTLQSPLLARGFVYANQATLTIRLRQKESGVAVAEKIVTIEGSADQIDFAEALQFALPVVPQPGLLEFVLTDRSGQGLDDRVTVPVNFPSDLGSGL